MTDMTSSIANGQYALPGLECLPGDRDHGLTLVLGPANSGKMGLALRWWQERLSRRPVFVVPTGPDTVNLNLEMVRRAGALIAQSPAVTFDGLVALVLGSRPHYLSGFQREIVLQRLLQEIPVRSLEGAAALPGTASALGGLLLELEESGEHPGQLEKAFKHWRDSRASGKSLAEDLARLLPAYAAAKAELGATDRPIAVIEATARVGAQAEVRSGKQREGQGGAWDRPVICYGFTSFTPGQRRLLHAIAAGAPVLVTLPYERGREINLTSDSEFQEWERAAERIVEMGPQPASFASPALYFLERNFMRDRPSGPPPPPVDGPSGVRFLLASGRRNEAELTAQEITALLKEGIAPGSVGVVVRDVGAWRRVLSDAFESCGIPSRVEGQVELSETGLGNAFLNVLRAFVTGENEPLLAYLRSPFSGMSRDRSADLELAFRRLGSPGVAELTDLTGGESREVLEGVETLVARNTDGHASPDLTPLRVLARSMLAASLAGATIDSRETEEDVKAFGAVTQAIGELADSGGIGAVGWERILPPLRRVPVSLGCAGEEDVVRVISLQRARARRFQVVFVLGLVEGELPGRRSRPSLLTREQRARMNAASGGRLLADDLEAEDAALFLSALSRPWQLLYLSARDADDAGQQAIPSFFWDVARRLTAVAEEGGKRGLGDVVYRSDEAPGARHYLRACVSEGRPAHPAVPGSRALRELRHLHNPPTRLRDPSNLAELAAQQSFAPSALERYLACPFSWFISALVGVHDAEPELDGATFGRLVHGVLSATYRDLIGGGDVPLRPENLDVALEIAKRHARLAVESGDCPGTAAERRLAAWRIRKLITGLLSSESTVESNLVPAETEVCVGLHGGVDVGGLCIHGRIDRIDRVGADGAHADGAGDPAATLFVVDYKSGEAPKPSQLGAEAGLQVPLYVLALAAEHPEAQVAGGAYVSLADGRAVGVTRAGFGPVLGSWGEGCKTLPLDEAAAFFEAAVATAARAAAGMRAGEIPPASTASGCPFYCSFGPICRSHRKGYRR